MVEQPADFQAAEVGGERQAGFVAEAVGAAGAGELGDGIGDAHILPDEGMVRGAAGVAVPKDGGFALIGDADGGEIARARWQR